MWHCLSLTARGGRRNQSASFTITGANAARMPFWLRHRSSLGVPLGFTMIELLVAIAIIGLLAALLLPAVQAAPKQPDGRNVATICTSLASRSSTTMTPSANFRQPTLPSITRSFRVTWASLVRTMTPTFIRMESICSPSWSKLRHRGRSRSSNLTSPLPI